MPAVKIFPQTAKQRLQDVQIPLADVERVLNQHLPQLPQVPEFGWGGCRPTDAGRRLKSALDGQHKFNLLQNIAHAKRRIVENVRQYIDGELIVWIRKFKYALNVIKVLQYIQRLVATANFYRSLIRQEIEVANHYCREGIALIEFAESNLTPANLRTQAERELADVWTQIKADCNLQINENNASKECLI